jgi:predicted CXXCH cytochrome family protein
MITCGALWLILAAVPALADGGPHVKDVNTGSLGLNADGCAGCHRAHTAQGPFLINAVDETALCKTCHGAVATGSTVDVMTGVQYSLRGALGVGGTQLGALRGGGFDEARIDASTIKDGSGVITAGPSRLTYQRTDTAVSQRPKVGVGAAEPVRSSHLALTENGLVNPGIAWGNGAAGSGAGPAVELSCTTCHNPHGNGQYRILRPLEPEAEDSNGIDETWTVAVRASYPDAVTGPPAYRADNIYTVVSHALQVGDKITIAGHAGSTPDLNGTWYVKAVGSGSLSQASSGTNNFSIAATLGGTTLDITVAGTGGTVTRTSGVVVTDTTLPGAGDTRNYTIMQVKGTEGTESTYLLYASQVAAAAAGTFYPSAAIASSNASTEVITTTVDHGLAGGNSVTITGHDAVPSINGTFTVLAAPTSKTFTLTGVDITTGGTAVGRVTKNAGAIPGTYAATGGDYFVRAVPWNPGINATCDPTANNDTAVQAGCATANSAPNGRPSTFSGQITSWCASCHTRYFANNNPTAYEIASSDATSETITTTLDHGLVVGNTVWITGHDAVATPAINGTYTVATAPSTKTFTLTGVDITASGTAIGTVSNLSSGATGASWGNPRPGDNLYKYQHRTVAGRDCLLCHVSHGSNAEMTGTFSSTYLYPDFTTASASSRLLKVDNRGTCQACHDPTETVPTGTYIGPSPVPAVP